MLPRCFLLLPALLLLGGCSTFESKFRRADVDRDGRLNWVEFSDGVAKVSFRYYDTNKDGYVQLEEWQAVELGTGDPKKFALRDLNHDGKISLAEGQKAAAKNRRFAKLFARVDTNHDGYIEIAEAKAYFHPPAAKKP